MEEHRFEEERFKKYGMHVLQGINEYRREGGLPYNEEYVGWAEREDAKSMSVHRSMPPSSPDHVGPAQPFGQLVVSNHFAYEPIMIIKENEVENDVAGSPKSPRQHAEASSPQQKSSWYPGDSTKKRKREPEGSSIPIPGQLLSAEQVSSPDGFGNLAILGSEESVMSRGVSNELLVHCAIPKSDNSMDVDELKENLEESQASSVNLSVQEKPTVHVNVGERSLVPFTMRNNRESNAKSTEPSPFASDTRFTPPTGFTIVSEELGMSLKAVKKSKRMPADHVSEGCCFCDVCCM